MLSSFEEKVIQFRDQGKSYAEIADMLNVSKGKISATVGKLIKAGRLKRMSAAERGRHSHVCRARNTQKEVKPTVTKEQSTLEQLLNGVESCTASTEQISVHHKELLIEILHKVIQ